MIIDMIGLDAVLAYIKSTNKSKFTILRANQNGSNIPVFECLDNGTVHNTAQVFEKWAAVMNNNNVYKIVLFDLLDDEDQGKKTKAKSGKMEAYFALKNPDTQFGGNDKEKGASYAEVRKQVAKEIAEEQREDLLMKKLQELEIKLASFEKLEEEEEEEEEEDQTILGALKNPETMQGIQALFSMLRSGTPPTVHGPTEQEHKTDASPRERLNSVIKRLYAVDKNLVEDLEILADMAENKRATFDMTISMLRSKNF